MRDGEREWGWDSGWRKKVGIDEDDWSERGWEWVEGGLLSNWKRKEKGLGEGVRSLMQSTIASSTFIGPGIMIVAMAFRYG